VAFARATIVGELKRHLRDCTWQMRMPRSLHDSYLMVVHTLDDLTQELGRPPLIPEVAARTGLTHDQVLEAMDVRYPVSLDRPANGNQYQEPTEDDSRIEKVQDDSLLASLLAPLTDQQRRVVRLYFVDGLSQHQIGDNLGVSQMCISRLLTKAIRQMRRHAERQARHE
jgi:RNA polymerase sigma-B factor